MNKQSDTAFIILAAGKGTRMQSALPKVLHKVNGKTMIRYVIESVKNITEDNIIIVLGYEVKKVKKNIVDNFKNVEIAIQEKLDGTASAVKVALPFIKDCIKNVVILCGDVPFIKPKSLQDILKKHKESKNILTLIGVKTENPTGYGRIIQNEKGDLLGIVEEKDATSKQKKIQTVNTGIYCVKREFLKKAINQIKQNNVQNEFYLTDLVKIAFEKGEKQSALISQNPQEFLGINTLEDLEEATKINTWRALHN